MVAGAKRNSSRADGSSAAASVASQTALQGDALHLPGGRVLPPVGGLPHSVLSLVLIACHSPRRRFEPYFDRKKKLMPKPSDLSFYNWETQTSTANATPNFQVSDTAY